MEAKCKRLKSQKDKDIENQNEKILGSLFCILEKEKITLMKQKNSMGSSLLNMYNRKEQVRQINE